MAAVVVGVDAIDTAQMIIVAIVVAAAAAAAAVIKEC